MTSPEAMGVELLPCPFCHDPMEIHFDVLRHQSQGHCPIAAQAWDVKFLPAWNRRTAPAVDGLEVVAWRYRFSNWEPGTFNLHEVAPHNAEVSEPLVRLSDAQALSTQVQRLTEENEALRKDAGELVVAQYALSAAEVRIKALEEALGNALAAGLPNVVAEAVRAALEGSQSK